ncbi:MAG: SDR family oxidoreductase [Alphaproteobacteria bacterium]|nr:SDR family oxidoreductase [Alphaproteobacteria bacterium]
MADGAVLLCFGHGYTARALARVLPDQEAGWSVIGTRRAPDEAAKLEGEGVSGQVFTRGQKLGHDTIQRATHILVSIPPDGEGDPVLAEHAEDLARAASRLHWIGYLSTTAVYGDRAGAWVDESSELRPVGARGRRRVEAEAGWLRLGREQGLPVHVFRLAGIYGPGRNALDQVRAGSARRILKPGQVFSRIHVADIVQVLLASMAQPNPGAVYNLADDEPAPPQAMVEHACTLLGVAPPPEEPFATAPMTEFARSFYAESKRVRNERIKRELGVRLAYPDFRAGLKALLMFG